MANRWVKLYASTLVDTIFNDADAATFKTWMWILVKVFFKPTTIFIGNQQVELKAGQMPFGRKAAAMELKINESKLYRIIKKLEKKGCISIESNNKFSIITVTNWGKYQCYEYQYSDDEQTDSNRTADEQQMNTIKNIKNNKNVYNISSSHTPVREDENPYTKPQVMGGTLGRNVLVLSEEQMDDLLEIMPLDTFHYYCNKLTDFMIDKNRKVNDHYGLILKWFNEDYGKRKETFYNEQY